MKAEVQATVDLESLNKSVIKACDEVSAFIRKEAEGFDRSRIEFKNSFNNLVSYVDKEAERELVSILHSLIPEAGFITEEGTGDEKAESEYQWIIDPLDGTTNFLHGLPVYAISVALARNRIPVLGVVYEITRKECFYAVENKPAFCNGKKIEVSPINQLNESLLATGFPYYHSDNQDAYLKIIKTFLNETHGIRRLGSAAVDLAYVSCGRLEGFFEYNLNPWDVAGGGFIVKQAGGMVTDFKGDPENYLFGGQLCAAGAVHEQMLGIIKPLWSN